MSDVTRILSAIEQGDPQAAEQLLPLVYEELRRLASQKMDREKPGQTLQATALVHEAYLRLVGNDVRQQWNSRGHFFAAAAEAMRRILVENARRRNSPTRGGDRDRMVLEDFPAIPSAPVVDLLTLDEALQRLSEEDPVKSEFVKLRFFAGLTMQEAADSLGISRATADRYWAYIKVWLYCQITGEKSCGEN